MKKDKARVEDEVWTLDRIRNFLDLQPPEGVDPDYHRLRRAYQSMRDEDFGSFVEMFVGAGGDITARGPAGKTVAEEITNHRYATEFLNILSHAAHNE